MSSIDILGGGNVEPRALEDEMRSAYLDYAMSVIVGRALPDVRDGLKPVHRRVLFSMSENGLTPTRPYRKCASVVGDVMGNYHPHGDSAIYDALARLAQVGIEDAAQADLIFSTLMGAMVEPRRQFIEDNARLVANLDV